VITILEILVGYDTVGGSIIFVSDLDIFSNRQQKMLIK
jgi:hypothetical protein